MLQLDATLSSTPLVLPIILPPHHLTQRRRRPFPKGSPKPKATSVRSFSFEGSPAEVQRDGIIDGLNSKGKGREREDSAQGLVVGMDDGSVWLIRLTNRPPKQRLQGLLSPSSESGAGITPGPRTPRSPTSPTASIPSYFPSTSPAMSGSSLQMDHRSVSSSTSSIHSTTSTIHHRTNPSLSLQRRVSAGVSPIGITTDVTVKAELTSFSELHEGHHTRQEGTESPNTSGVESMKDELRDILIESAPPPSRKNGMLGSAVSESGTTSRRSASPSPSFTARNRSRSQLSREVGTAQQLSQTASISALPSTSTLTKRSQPTSPTYSQSPTSPNHTHRHSNLPSFSLQLPSRNNSATNPQSTTMQESRLRLVGKPIQSFPPSSKSVSVGSRHVADTLIVEEKGWIVTLQSHGRLNVHSILDGRCISTLDLSSPTAWSSGGPSTGPTSQTHPSWEFLTLLPASASASIAIDPSQSSIKVLATACLMDDSEAGGKFSTTVVDLDRMSIAGKSSEMDGLALGVSVVTDEDNSNPDKGARNEDNSVHYSIVYLSASPTTTKFQLISLLLLFQSLDSQHQQSQQPHNEHKSTKEHLEDFTALFKRSSSPRISSPLHHQSGMRKSSSELGAGDTHHSLHSTLGYTVHWIGVELPQIIVSPSRSKYFGLASFADLFIVWNNNGVEVLNKTGAVETRFVGRDIEDVQTRGQDEIFVFTKGKILMFKVQSNPTRFEKIATDISFPVSATPAYLRFISDPRTSDRSSFVLLDESLNSFLVVTEDGSRSLEGANQMYPDDDQVEQGTALLLTSSGLVYLGTSGGVVLRKSLQELIQEPATYNGTASPSSENPYQRGLDGRVTCLCIAANTRTSESHVVAGGDDGGIVIWDEKCEQVLHRWNLFSTSVTQMVFLGDNSIDGRLAGCLLVISASGDLCAVFVDGFEVLISIPASRTNLSKLFVSEGDLVLVYEDGTARLWDLHSHELRRAIAGPKDLEDTVGDATKWKEISMNDGMLAQRRASVIGALGASPFPHTNTDWNLLLDLSAVSAPPSANQDTDDTSPLASPPSVDQFLKQMPVMLSLLHSYGLDEDTDEVVAKLFVASSQVVDGISIGAPGCDSSLSVIPQEPSADVWKVSPAFTGLKLLAIVTILRLISAVEGLEPLANELISFYCISLPSTIGTEFQYPELSFLTQYWLHSVAEIQQAARLLFVLTVSNLSEAQTTAVVEQWQPQLPSLQPRECRTVESAQALIILGHTALAKYTLLSPVTLKDVSSSIVLYLHEDNSPYRMVAIELCAQGFHIWQHYVDAIEVLRALFRLATKKLNSNTDPAHKVLFSQARIATLQIAASNTPLFMTTISFDILNAPNPAQRNATMRLVALIAKKRPLIMYSSLARIAEAVVKSLDPNASGNAREVVLQTATIILDSLVGSFPSIDFHGKSQKLAVGTHEGAVIVYDLKTATRLYVLEGHKHKITAVSFSPDGRRLVTLSLEESKVVIWKVGVSFSSMFNVGVPPKQGGKAVGDPYKEFNFNIGDEGNMTISNALEWVKFEWPQERSARLKIRETTLTFAT